MPTSCNNVICWSFLSSTCFGYIRPSSGALDVELQHTVFCTQFVGGWWSWEPLRRSCVRCGWCRATTTNWVQKTICCNLTSNAPDDVRMRPKHVELRKLEQIAFLHQVGISLYFMMKMHGQTTLKLQSVFVSDGPHSPIPPFPPSLLSSNSQDVN